MSSNKNQEIQFAQEGGTNKMMSPNKPLMASNSNVDEGKRNRFKTIELKVNKENRGMNYPQPPMDPEEVKLNVKPEEKTFEDLKAERMVTYDKTLQLVDTQNYGKGTTARIKSVKSVMINAVDKPNYQKVILL